MFRNRIGRCIDIKRATAVITLATIVILTGMWTTYNKKTVNAFPEFKTIQPKTKNLYDYVNATGKIKEGNKKNLYIDGIAEVIAMLVKEGEFVEKDDVIARVRPISVNELKPDIYHTGRENVISVFEEYGVDLGIDNRSLVDLSSNAEVIEIRSPISGVITNIRAKQGDAISTINSFLTVSDFSDLYISAMVPEEYSSKIEIGQNVDITAEAFGSFIYKGKIESISPTATYIPSITGDGKTYVEAKVSLNETRTNLRPGLSVNSKIAVKTREKTITLPYECILQDKNDREYVYCLKEDDSIQKKYIRVGYELENEAEIIKGVDTNDNVIIDPPKELLGE